MFECDLCVIGAGSAGVRAARMAAQQGARVCIIEQARLGGTCVNVGCVPKKFYVLASEYRHNFSLSRDFGWAVNDTQFSMRKLRDAKDKAINRLNAIYQSLLDEQKVTSLFATASFIDNRTIQAGDTTVRAKKILIATGCLPALPADIGNSHLAMVSDDVFAQDTLPGKIIIYGGGYIAIEFACFYNSLGVETHLFYRGNMILRKFDAQLADWAVARFRQQGLHIHLQTTLEKIERNGNTFTVTHTHNGKQATSTCNQVLLATGRKANTQGLNLAAAGVHCNENGFIPVDKQYQTNVPHIFALGDITGGKQLTPLATAEAMDFVRLHYNQQLPYKLPKFTATAIFCQPTIATVGLTEQEARQTHDIAIFTSEFTALNHSLGKRSERCMMKVLVDKKSDRVLAVNMIGHGAGEIVQGFAAAMEAGITKQQLDTTLGIHPTTAEELVTMYTPA